LYVPAAAVTGGLTVTPRAVGVTPFVADREIQDGPTTVALKLIGAPVLLTET
jgi:hypothetical protein